MWFGLEAEEYDRSYGDRVLLKRIMSYFSKYKRQMIIVIFLLTSASMFRALIPVLTSFAINNIGSSQNAFFLILIVLFTFPSAFLFSQAEQTQEILEKNHAGVVHLQVLGDDKEIIT